MTDTLPARAVAARVTVNCPRCRGEVSLPVYVNTVRYDDQVHKEGAVAAGVTAGMVRHHCEGTRAT